MENFHKNIEWFVKNIDSRKAVLPAFAHIASKLFTKIDRDMDAFIKDHGYDIVYDEDGDVEEFGVPTEYSGRYNTLRKSLDQSLIFAELLPNMTVVSLVSLFDAYLAKLIRSLFETQPEILNASEKIIKYSDLIQYEKIDDAKEYLISSEIESIIRDSHTEQFKWIEGKLKIPLRDLDSWKNFIEITERRNLFVHTDGVINKQYIAVCNMNGYKFEDEIKIGERLNVDPDYYGNACDCIAEIGIKLGQVMWRKTIPNEAHLADLALIDVVYDCLLNKDFELALSLCKLCEIPAIKNSCLENSYTLKINQAVALKSLKREKDMLSIIDAIDWSVMAEKFKLAIYVLKENWSDAASIMIKMGSDGDINKVSYHEWPLFEWFRKTSEFKDAYKKVYGENFKITGKPHDSDDTSQ